MQLEDYFAFLSPLDIRVRGTRIGIETILTEYLENGRTGDEIVAEYRTLNHEQVYATLTYYWRNTKQMREYLRLVDEEIQRQRAEQDRNPSPGVVRLRALGEELRRQAAAAAMCDSGPVYDECLAQALRAYRQRAKS